MKYPIPFLIVGVLAGCTTSPKDCDPRNVGFLSAASGVMSGCYSERQNQLNEELVDQQNVNDSLRQLLVSIEEEKKWVGKQRSNEEANLSAINQSWLSLKAALDKKAKTNQSLQSRIDQLQRKMDRVNSTSTLEQAEKERRLESLRRYVDLLMAELEAEMY